MAGCVQHMSHPFNLISDQIAHGNCQGTPNQGAGNVPAEESWKRHTRRASHWPSHKASARDEARHEHRFRAMDNKERLQPFVAGAYKGKTLRKPFEQTLSAGAAEKKPERAVRV